LIELADTHAHLQDEEFDPDRDAVIERARAAGVTTIVLPAVDLAAAEHAIDLAERYDGLYATAGYHPHEAQHWNDSALGRIEALLAHEKVVAVGEIGLDFYRMHSPREAQFEAFEAQLALAERYRLPVVIHCRDAWEEMAPILEPWARRVRPMSGDRPIGVLHYFSSTLEDASRYHDLGFTISIHTSVTHPKAQMLGEVAAALPLDAVVIETDSPYGAPQSVRGRRNEPSYVVEAAKQIAALHGVDTEAVASATTATARRLFGLSASVQNGAAIGVRR
jgi:TatD DNase family protein